MFTSSMPNHNITQTVTKKTQQKNLFVGRRRTLSLFLICSLPVAVVTTPVQAQTTLPPPAPITPVPVTPTPPPPTSISPATADPLIGPIRKNDIISVQVAEEPTLSGQFRVTSEGKVGLPLAGQISLIGQMPSEAADAITGVYKKKNLLRNPQVVVTIIGRPERTIFVAGALEKQGRIILADKTHLDEVLEPSGVSAVSDLGHVVITRGEQKITVDYLAYRTGNDTPDGANNPLLEDGDKVYVRARVQVAGTIKINGEVKSPQTAPFTEKLTASQAVQQAGGVTEFADRDRIVVSRNGKEIPVPYKAIQEGQTDKDIPLQDKDEIFVRRVEVPKIYRVNGGVTNRNSFPITSDTTLSDAIAAAGGFVDGVDQKKITIERKNDKGQVVVQKVSYAQDLSSKIQPDDVINVPYPAQRKSKPDFFQIFGPAVTLYGLFGRGR